MTEPRYVSRRHLLGGALTWSGLATASALGLTSGAAEALARRGTTNARSSIPRRPRKHNRPGTLPNPGAPAGSDQLPEITTIVALMMENHTYDNLLGTMPGRGNGFTVVDGVPTNSNPWPAQSVTPPPFANAVLQAFPMPNPCQQQAHPYNTWLAGNVSFDNGLMDGFVKSQSGPVSMGYYDSTYMPFVNSLAQTFPVCDNYFSSVMAQTYPNRRFFMAGTSWGLTDDTLNGDRPRHGTIFEMLNTHGISWKNYYAGSFELTSASIAIWTYLLSEPSVYNDEHVVPISDFFTDAANGTLPAYSMVDPNYGSSSEEDPQDVQFGDQFMSQIVNAVMSSPQWPHTMLVWTYDEGGGYYDHVPPPTAIKPDERHPIRGRHQDLPHGTPFNRYGFRVPSGVVSPYAKPEYVSSVVYDHTSILKLIETKWNLPALTYRDANAANLLDTVNLSSPAFLTPPTLVAPADPSVLQGCLMTGPGTIPPSQYVTTS